MKRWILASIVLMATSTFAFAEDPAPRGEDSPAVAAPDSVEAPRDEGTSYVQAPEHIPAPRIQEPDVMAPETFSADDVLPFSSESTGSKKTGKKRGSSNNEDSV